MSPRAASEQGGQQEGDAQPPNKRRRIALACSSCRARKSRCDGARPVCSLCRELGFDCVYAFSASSSNAIVGKDYLSGLESRLEQVELALSAAGIKVQEPSTALSQNAHRSNAARSPSQNDGLPHLDDPAPENDSVDGMGAVTFEPEEESAYFGPSSNIALLRHISRAMVRMGSDQAWTTPNTASPTLVEGGFISIPRPPSPAGLSQTVRKAAKSRPNLYALPPDEEAISWIMRYFSDTGLLYPYIHPETFINTYRQMRRQTTEKIRRSWLGLLNMIIAMATNAVVDPMINAADRIAKSDVFYQRAQGLCQKQIMRGASLEIVQMLLLMGQYLQGTQKPMEAWVLHGVAVKAAFALGLHCHASLSFSPLEREVRKRTWYGCVVLDRTLSMTFGRPCSIPDSYIKLPLPEPYPPCSSEEDLPIIRQEGLVVAFYRATITLHKIMAKVIESLYADDLVSYTTAQTNDIAAQLFHREQELAQWECSLPTDLKLVTQEEVAPIDPTQIDSTDSQEIIRQRYRNVLTLRYLNLRLLLHRPVLTKLIDSSVNGRSATAESSLLQQMRQHSLKVCAQSADLVIRIVDASLQADCRPRWNLIGAWWFSLYYTFNAALVITACLLASENKGSDTVASILSTEQAFEGLFRAQSALKRLDSHNQVVDRCCHYLEQSTQMVKTIVLRNPQAQAIGEFSSLNASNQQQSNGYAPLHADSISSAFELDLGQFVLGSDFDMLQQQLVNGCEMARF